MKKFNPEKALLETRREFGEHGGVAPSISRSSTFTVLDPNTMPEIFDGLKVHDKDGCYLYSRHFNPTVDLLSRYLAAMEGTESAMCTGSGMAAISCTLMQLCKGGDHIISSSSIYGGTHALLNSLLPEMNINTTFINSDDPAEFEKAIKKETKVIYVEIIGNPKLNIANINALSKISKKNGIKLVVDNTFMPMAVSPSFLGADIVVYSMTKYINGASDLLAGAICASNEFIGELMNLHTGRIMLFGPTMDPRVAFDILQRLPHLAARMKEHSKRAQILSEVLFDLNVPVVYPGLSDFSQHSLIKSQLNSDFGFGGIFTIDCRNTNNANKLLALLQNKEQFGYIAVSLGYFDTLMSCSGSSTSSEISDEEQEEIGLSPGLVRISVGLTGTIEDRIEQLKRAVKESSIF